MKFFRAPTFTVGDSGPWGVDSAGKFWYVVNGSTLRGRRVGVVGGKRTNYFDRAIALARSLNAKDAA